MEGGDPAFNSSNARNDALADPPLIPRSGSAAVVLFSSRV